MLSRGFVFWEVDVQTDFMLPDGKTPDEIDSLLN
jgi:hypothetical protein